MKRKLTKILNLPGVFVTEQKAFENTLILEIESQSKKEKKLVDFTSLFINKNF